VRTRVSDLLIKKVREHGAVSAADEAALRAVNLREIELEPGQDVVREGERPDVSVLVVSGMLARYQMLIDGQRQYISFHIAGDFPDIPCGPHLP
jgi:CRP-like cAMP-binding protein